MARFTSNQWAILQVHADGMKNLKVIGTAEDTQSLP